MQTQLNPQGHDAAAAAARAVPPWPQPPGAESWRLPGVMPVPEARPEASAVRAAGRTHPDIAMLRRAFAPAQPAEATLERLRTHSLVVRHGIGRLDLPGPTQPVPAWWLLRRGRMSIGWEAEGGDFVEKHLIGPGEWLDVAGALSQPAAWVDAAQCRTPVELLALPVRTLFQACAEDPELMRAVGTLLSGRVRSLSDTLHDVVTADVPARLARWLLRRLGTDRPGGAVPPTLVLTELKQSIAAQLGTTSETFSRALRRLADAGIVRVKGYELALLDVAALQGIAYPAARGSARQSFASRAGRSGSAAAAG